MCGCIKEGTGRLEGVLVEGAGGGKPEQTQGSAAHNLVRILSPEAGVGERERETDKQGTPIESTFWIGYHCE